MPTHTYIDTVHIYKVINEALLEAALRCARQHWAKGWRPCRARGACRERSCRAGWRAQTWGHRAGASARTPADTSSADPSCAELRGRSQAPLAVGGGEGERVTRAVGVGRERGLQGLWGVGRERGLQGLWGVGRERGLQGLWGMHVEEFMGIWVFKPFTPKSDQCPISPAASREILHYTVWRTWLFIAYSDERWLYYQFSLPYLYISIGEVRRMYFWNLGVKGLSRGACSNPSLVRLLFSKPRYLLSINRASHYRKQNPAPTGRTYGSVPGRFGLTLLREPIS